MSAKVRIPGFQSAPGLIWLLPLGVGSVRTIAASPSDDGSDHSQGFRLVTQRSGSPVEVRSADIAHTVADLSPRVL